MSDTVRFHCPKCGEQEVDYRKFTLELPHADSEYGSWRAPCPKCGVVARDFAKPRTVNVFRAMGVAVDVHNPTADPITVAEVEAFAGSLEADPAVVWKELAR